MILLRKVAGNIHESLVITISSQALLKIIKSQNEGEMAVRSGQRRKGKAVKAKEANLVKELAETRA